MAYENRVRRLSSKRCGGAMANTCTVRVRAGVLALDLSGSASVSKMQFNTLNFCD